MNIRILISIIALTCCSCSQKSKDEQPSDSTSASNKVESKASSIANKPDEQIFDSLKQFDLTKIPLNWTRLTKTDSANIIYESCDGGNKLISFDPTDSTIMTHGQQEDFTYRFKQAGISTSGIIYFQIDGFAKNELFSLNQLDSQKRTAIWTTIYGPSYEPFHELFIPTDLEDEYTRIEQPCRDCWDDEFCDELEKREHRP